MPSELGLDMALIDPEERLQIVIGLSDKWPRILSEDENQ